MDTQQMELAFEGGAASVVRLPRRGVSPARAQWWFDRIHRILREAAVRGRPARPEQGHLALGRGGRPGSDRVRATVLSGPAGATGS